MKKNGFICLLTVMAMTAQGGLTRAADIPDPSAVPASTPCTLHADSSEIQLDFKSVIDRYLYRYGLTPARSFTLRLNACDSRVLAGARLRMAGNESRELPGLLVFDGTGMARGVVIGLQATDGQRLAVNAMRGHGITVVPEDGAIALQAYLEVEPTAQNSKSIILESFRATVFVALDYQ
ncbi:fimbrial protein [Pseudomonas sp. 8O]|uniref:fimbrial protein n=1 Tax=Pseudomonas sp. 8O TaxID=2653165 RepID=UPI0012F24287|nr:hypothetical protein [Pseudomonas sp. 8O]VXC36454.1 conserved exported hypothetical protein [Pseudomonas sp. 8O]